MLESAACLIGHAPSLAALVDEGESGPLALVLDAIDGVRGAEGWLHLEVVGSQASPGPETAAKVANHLREQGASHLFARRSLGRDGQPGLARHGLAFRPASWPAAAALSSASGASRVVGLPPRIVFDRDGSSTFEELRLQLSN